MSRGGICLLGWNRGGNVGKRVYSPFPPHIEQTCTCIKFMGWFTAIGERSLVRTVFIFMPSVCISFIFKCYMDIIKGTMMGRDSLHHKAAAEHRRVISSRMNQFHSSRIFQVKPEHQTQVAFKGKAWNDLWCPSWQPFKSWFLLPQKLNVWRVKTIRRLEVHFQPSESTSDIK